MKVITGGGAELDLRGRKFVLAVADGGDAEIHLEGSSREVGQLLDAALRAVLDEKTEEKQVC